MGTLGVKRCAPKSSPALFRAFHTEAENHCRLVHIASPCQYMTRRLCACVGRPSSTSPIQPCNLPIQGHSMKASEFGTFFLGKLVPLWSCSKGCAVKCLGSVKK